ncbi:CD166 antigen homolog A isoform X2 [Denticeps clupeoides]|uniref:Ig-like domain-containing protein n=1 Tax=Denticeps clupeoides TaxID=299321 RepID=A0AAY4D697_9TELE|nr:CD166 antigen isoform X2 [Denticeps clupeoides]
MPSSAACLLRAFVAAVMCLPVSSSIPTAIGSYGENIEVPCFYTTPLPSDLIFIKWKYTQDDGLSGDLLVKQAQKAEATISAMGLYKDRVSLSNTSSLILSKGVLADQRTFTCMVVGPSSLNEYPVQVKVYKKPSAPQIKNKAKELENGKLTMLGECVTQDANPAANVTWAKNGQPLVNDGSTVKISNQVTVNKATGLSTTTSALQYTAGKGDVDSKFTCLVQQEAGPVQTTTPETFTINYPTEKMSLQVVGEGTLKEGDSLVLKCQADGNPPPTKFYFHIKGQKVPVDNDTLVMPGVTRDKSGQYKCSLYDNEKMEATKDIVVNYLDLSLSPSGSVLKNHGEALPVTVLKNASGEVKVWWTKDNVKLEKQPDFKSLRYADAGLYLVEASLAGIKRTQSFQLVVQGKPIITHLSKAYSTDKNHKVLTCEAEGSPKPTLQWSVNGTDEENFYDKGKVIYKITVVPSQNLTVSCTASNALGEESRFIDVFSYRYEDADQAKVIVGVVVGLLLAAAIVGLIYWVYMKKSRQGSWKTGEKETGTSEEEKKLEENNHKAEV